MRTGLNVEVGAGGEEEEEREERGAAGKMVTPKSRSMRRSHFRITIGHVSSVADSALVAPDLAVWGPLC